MSINLKTGPAGDKNCCTEAKSFLSRERVLRPQSAEPAYPKILLSSCGKNP